MGLNERLDSEIEEQMRGLECSDWVGVALGVARAVGVVVALAAIGLALAGLQP
jgi:hypothetical protein